MAKKIYVIEREGQMDFFDNYHIPYDGEGSALIDNTDGIYNGNILEFKLSISNPNRVLFQAIKYLSKERVKGHSVPKNILLIDLNNTIVYKYDSEDYIDDIQKIYNSAASKDNSSFSGKSPNDIFDYSDMLASNKLKKILCRKKTEEEKYIPIDLDENCIVGWAERYYVEVPKATKGDFLGDGTGKINVSGEIRDPRHFKGLINPYTAPTNEKFKYLMDCLNDRLNKKDLGAFYTPEPYCKKAAELVEMAVQRALDGGKRDYIILDRCAGTGNLEAALVGLFDANGDELISHCVVSTYEYYEYKVLNERLGDKVRDIIPPTEADVVYANGMVSNADAMSEEFISNPIIKQYVDDEDCAVILFENPPFSEVAGNSEKAAKENSWKSSYAAKEMKQELRGTATNDSASVFIWSGFKYYIRQKTDSYIVFSPIKYWKSGHIIDKHACGCYIFNRKHFHAGESSVCCVYWVNEHGNDAFHGLAYEIVGNDTVKIADVKIKKVFHCFSEENDKRKFPDDVKTNFTVGKDGYIKSDVKVRIVPIYNKNIVGYLMHCGYAFGNPVQQTQLTRAGYYGGNGYFLRKDNYIKKLPLFVAGWFTSNWYHKDIVFRSLDGGDAYTKDLVFLKSCLIYTCLSNQNKCLTFQGSDGRHYQNELCFDNGTIASNDLAKMILDEEESNLIELWKKILEEARNTGKCNPDWTYGVYQITKEINTSHKERQGKKEITVYDYPQLNGNLDTLRTRLKAYYKSHITDKMFEYELIK